MIIIASILMWIGGTLGVIGMLALGLIIFAWAYDAYRRRKARHARGYELPDPQARPAPRFTHKPQLPEQKPTSAPIRVIRVKHLPQ